MSFSAHVYGDFGTNSSICYITVILELNQDVVAGNLQISISIIQGISTTDIILLFRTAENVDFKGYFPYLDANLYLNGHKTGPVAE